jgi:hypothetical protein
MKTANLYTDAQRYASMLIMAATPEDADGVIDQICDLAVEARIERLKVPRSRVHAQLKARLAEHGIIVEVLP